MASYNLTNTEKEIITSWLFEVGGYLDNAVNDLGVSARQARIADPTLNVLTWIRTNTMSPLGDLDSWNQCAMMWWIRISDGVNINPPNRPPERVTWRGYLTLWESQLVANPGGVTPIPVTAEDGTISTIPANAHRVQQRNMIAKVLDVM